MLDRWRVGHSKLPALQANLKAYLPHIRDFLYLEPPPHWDMDIFWNSNLGYLVLDNLYLFIYFICKF